MRIWLTFFVALQPQKIQHLKLALVSRSEPENSNMFVKKMKWIGVLTMAILMSCPTFTYAQYSFAQHSEVGLWLGSGTYFGDLNRDFSFQKTKPAVGVLYRFHYNEYVSLKAGVGLTWLAHADSLSNNPFQKVRNLSFKTSLIEAAAQIDLHFKRFRPGDERHAFTPYLTMGLAAFYFNPKAELNGETYNLQALGTEGQQNTDFSGRKPYRKIQLAIPIGVGVKYWMRGNWTCFFEVNYRTALTDYLDDVSTTYVDPFILGDGTVTAALADRSLEVGETRIGEVGRQRGDSVTTDGYLMVNAGITFVIFNKKCMTPR